MPPPALVARRQKLFRLRLSALYRSIVLMLVLVGVGYGVAYGVLWYTAVPDSQEGTAASVADVEKQTRQTNASVQLIHNHLIKKPPWMTELSQVLTLAPASVTILSLEMEDETQTVMVSGRGDSRESVLQFERALRALPWAKSVEAPLQNFASGPDVTFRFTIVRRL